jgi:ligand-binding sensor domain-containing protein
VSPSSFLRHDVLTTWTTDQGLPQNFIRAITQTADGFIWVGTMNGLARFDGLRFRGFSKDGPSELQDNIVALAPDSSQGLWIATATCLFHYYDQRFQAILLRGTSHYRIEGMSSARGVWLFTGGKLFRSHGDSLEEHPIPATTHSYAISQKQQMVRFGSRTGNLFSLFATTQGPLVIPLLVPV